MQGVSKDPQDRKKISSASVRNIAIAIAAVAIGYGQLAPLFSPKHNADNTMAEQASPALMPMNAPITSGVVPDISSDANAQVFRDFMNAQIKHINDQGHVVFGASDIPQPASTSPAQAPQGSVQPQPSIPNEQIGASSSTTRTEVNGALLTKHSAPFVDQQAVASIQEHREAVAKSGKMAVIRIGAYADGTLAPEYVKAEQVRGTLSTIPDEWTVTYKAPNEKLRIYAFTDPTCPYCQKLHHSIPQLLEAGISVHYMLYPRDLAGVHPGEMSRTAENLKNVWCSVDQNAAMNDAFAGYKIPTTNCETLPAALKRLPPPIPDHYQLGEIFEVKGTPTILASNGKSQSGFGTANQLIRDFLN